jgi:endoglucanase
VKNLIPLGLAVLAAHLAAAQTNLPPMKPLTNPNSPAHLAAARFMRGANIGNCLEVPPSQDWQVPHTVDDLKLIRAQGFDHIRVPVGWHHYTLGAPDYPLQQVIFDKTDYFVTNATALGLNIILNIHHFNQFYSNPAANTAKFLAIWRQVAAHYASAPPGVAFELLNEPNDAATTAVLNPIYAQAIREIRKTNPHRAIFVAPGDWDSVFELPNLRLPDNDDDIIVTVHCYLPMLFTHQGASWAPDTEVTGVFFPGPPREPLHPDPRLNLKPWLLERVQQYNTLPPETNPSGPGAFLPAIQKAKAWSQKYGRPIYMGEFGAIQRADQPSRARYYKAMRQAMEAEHIGWAIWDWKSGFNYWDTKNHRPLPGMHEALFQ